MTIWLGTGVLLVAALAFVLVPAWTQFRRTDALPITSLVVSALLVPFAIGLYLTVTTWSEDAPSTAQVPGVAEMVEELALRLEQNPDDVQGWQLLGQSYLAMGEYAEARRALREAWSLTPEPNDVLRVALGEAEALADQQSLAGEAGALFDEVLANDPNNQKALWYGGLSALVTQRPDLARERWSRLLAFNPPENVAQVLRQQLQALGGVIENVDTAQADDAEVIRLLISVDDALADGVPDAASLFIFARNPAGGPPVAVMRASAAALPGEFALSDANAMMPGSSLGDFETLSIVARISQSGQPTAQPGDLFGEISYRPGQDLSVQQLLIDQSVP
ncbi:MAG: tetratricopeptide repeat protein [Gammaproteobacteria bacterium]|nr:tetratricopeptide repeat protein [Gammaproteobacteria bacterium]